MLSPGYICQFLSVSYMFPYFLNVQCCMSDWWAMEEHLLALNGIHLPLQWTNRVRILTQDWQRAKAQTLHLFSVSRSSTALTIFHFLKKVCEFVCSFHPQLNPDVTCGC